jgi:hypothetical protein
MPNGYQAINFWEEFSEDGLSFPLPQKHPFLFFPTFEDPWLPILNQFEIPFKTSNDFFTIRSKGGTFFSQ